MLNFVLKTLKVYKNYLSRQQLLTLRGQAIAGDYIGALKGIEKLVPFMNKKEQ